MSDKFLDYSKFRDSFLTNWREAVPNSSDDLWTNLNLLFDACFEMPEHELQKHLILAAITTPSAMSTNLPVVFLWGQSGKGMESFIENELRITSQEVLDFLKKRVADGSLELSRLDNSIVHQLMTQQGFKPQSNKQGLIWTKKL